MRSVSRPLVVVLASVLSLASCGSAPPTPASTSPSAQPEATGPASPAGSAGSVLPPSAPAAACSAATTPASHDWNERTWYEVFVRSFADGNGDGIGDLKGLTAKLDYLNDGNPSTHDDLGVGGIWLMPIAASPSYHGYDVTDETKVEPDYGSLADLKAFVAAAHARGIKVILDLVLNHTSAQHPWFRDARTPGSAHDDWYVWSATNPGWASPANGGPAWHEANGRWFYGAFSDQMPDLNLRNPAVTAELEKVAAYWLTEAAVDGFRLDAARHLIEDDRLHQTNTPETKTWLAGFKSSVDSVQPGALLVGEVWDSATAAGSYVPASVDMTFNFPLAAGIRLAVQGKRSAPLLTALDETLRAWPANQAASFLTNHDQDRIMSQLLGDGAAARLAAFSLFTLPGVPFVYYGEEIGMQGRKPDERIRTPMQWSPDGPAGGFSTHAPWEPLADDWKTVNVAAETGDTGSLLTTYRDLIALRAATPALRDGQTTVVDGGADPVIGWLRTTADQQLLTVVNLSDEPVSDYALTLDTGPLCGTRTARLVGAVGGDPAATVTPPTTTPAGGLDAWRPLPELAPRAGYLFALEPAP